MSLPGSESPSYHAALASLDFVAFDTETTGLAAAQDRLVELAAVRFRFDGEELGRFDQLIDPGRPIPKVASRIHGLGDNDVKGCPRAGEVLPGFADFVAGAVLLAHNAEFDVAFLTHEAQRSGVALPRLPILDTVEMSRRLRSDLPNHRLGTLATALRCEASTYHRALADAQTVQRCFVRLLADTPGEETLGDVLARTGAALTFGPPDCLRIWLPPELSALEQALQEGRKVTIGYAPSGRREERVEIRPRGYLRRPGVTHLMAQSVRDGKDRAFNLDEIRSAHFAQATLF